MGSKPPDFAPADNPASDSDSLLTRTLTFLFLPAFNFWLLLCPRWLSFDWSMESIPLLTSPFDPRNALSACFYAAGFRFLLHISRAISAQKSSALLWNHRLKSSRNGTYNKAVIINNNSHAYANGHHRTSNGNGVIANGSPSATLYHQTSTSSAVDSYQCPASAHTDAVIIATSLLVFPFVPATNLFFYVGFVVAERVLYVPSMGFCLLVAVGLDQLYRKQEGLLRKRILLSVFLSFVIIMSVRTVRRNRDWWHEENLYRSGIPINPPKGKHFILNQFV